MRAEKIENLEAETIYKVIRQLIGRVDPQGESNFDAKAFDNLKILCEVTEKLIVDIDEVAYKNVSRHEASMKRAGQLANEWCKKYLAE